MPEKEWQDEEETVKPMSSNISKVIEAFERYVIMERECGLDSSDKFSLIAAAKAEYRKLRCNPMIIDGITVIPEEGITEEEIKQIVSTERLLWLQKGKELGKVELTIDGEEIVVKASERSKIKRLRRITGYLSEVDRFNPAKQSELSDRKPHI